MLGLLWLRNLRLLSGMRLFSGTRSISRLGAVVVTNDVIVYATQAVFCHGAHKMSQYSEYSEYSEYSALILRVALQSNSVSCTLSVDVGSFVCAPCQFRVLILTKNRHDT